jgi:hypothetical protein
VTTNDEGPGYNATQRDIFKAPRIGDNGIIQGDKKVSVNLMITIQKVTSNVQSVPRQFPDIY